MRFTVRSINSANIWFRVSNRAYQPEEGGFRILVKKWKGKLRGQSTRAGGKRAHDFDYACPAETCCRGHLVLSMSHVGHAVEHALACSEKNSGSWRALFN